MTAHVRHRIAATLAVGVLVASAACSNGGGRPGTGTSPTGGGASRVEDSSPPNGTKVTGGRIDIELQDPAMNALRRAGITWRAKAPARKDGGDELRLPISGGRISYQPLSGSVLGRGSAIVAKGAKTATLTSVVVDLDDTVIRGKIGGKNLTVAKLDTSEHEAEHTKGPVADLDDIDVTYTPAAVRALNDELGTSLPANHVTAELETHVRTR